MALLDPFVGIAFSLYSGKGTYALLLGSGVSRSANIPTGWEVVKDLTQKLAVANGQGAVPDPAKWYESQFGESPSYSKLLDRLGSSREERNTILRRYFEASDEERQQGVKTPTEAHRSIAKLVAGGYVRVILTLNFDRLMEMALEAEGVVPTVLSTPDAIEGTIPVQFHKCTLVKLNGDYMDLRMKNTVEELTVYDPRTASLLDRILDEFGFVVCGWSADWDLGLRSAMERARSHRFNLYWTHRGPMSDHSGRLLALRRGTPVEIKDADSFFRVIAAKVSALEAYEHPHPLSAQLAAASVKRFVSDPRHVISLSDLVREETERLYAYISGDQFPVTGQSLNHAAVKMRVEQLEIAGAILFKMLAVGCRWGKAEHQSIWSDCIERLANFPVQGGLTILLELRRYIGILSLYSGGIAALSAGNFQTLRALFVDAKVRNESDPDLAVVIKQFAGSILDHNVANKSLYQGDDRHTPMSDRIHFVLRDPLREVVPDDRRYDELFDKFEYLLSLKILEETEKQKGRDWAPLGRFAWHDRQRTIFDRIVNEAKDAAQQWEPAKARLFESHESFIELCKSYKEKILPYADRMW